jgi:hypothetical protein
MEINVALGAPPRSAVSGLQLRDAERRISERRRLLGSRLAAIQSLGKGGRVPRDPDFASGSRLMRLPVTAATRCPLRVHRIGAAVDRDRPAGVPVISGIPA